jgi:hypothetical protein
MRAHKKDDGKAGRRLALFIAGTGLFYVLATLIGDEYGWSNRTMGLIGLVALAGFGVALIKAIGLWRARKE